MHFYNLKPETVCANTCTHINTQLVTAVNYFSFTFALFNISQLEKARECTLNYFEFSKTVNIVNLKETEQKLKEDAVF